MPNALNLDSLNDLLVNEDVLTNGRWVQPDPDRPFKVLTRGITDGFRDAQTRMQTRAAKPYNGDTKRIGSAQLRVINAECLIRHSLLGVEKCVIGDKEYNFEEFCDLIKQPRGQNLLSLAFAAALQATEEQEAEITDAVGN